MIRGHPPYVAIAEAERKAKAKGLVVFALEPAGELPFHFIICDGDCISLVRVRRLKYPGSSVEEIKASCKKDIAELRSITVTAEIFRELWVRGPDRHWFRYLVLAESVEAMDGWDVPEDSEESGKERPVKPEDAAEPVKDDGNGDEPLTRLTPKDPAVPDDRAGGADTGNRSESLPVPAAGAGTP